MGGALDDPDSLTREDDKGQPYTGGERSSQGQLSDSCVTSDKRSGLSESQLSAC